MRTLAKFLTITACVALAASPSLAMDESAKKDLNKQIQLMGFSPGGATLASLFETEPNDDCTAPDPASPLGNDITGAIDVAGDEDWFAFDGMAGDCVTFATDAVNGSTTDTQLYIYDAANCTDLAASIAFNDDGGPGLFSLIDGFELPADGTYYLRVKHFNSTVGVGEYSLTGSLGACPQPPANDSCDNVIALDCNSTVTGTTDLAANDVEDLAEVCVPFGADGPDVFYSVVVADGQQLDVLLTPNGWDPAVWIMTDCNDASTCLAGADAGFFDDPEMVSWTNDTGSDQTIYVVPDGFFSGASGEFTLSITCDNVVSDDTSTWGAVKSRF